MEPASVTSPIADANTVAPKVWNAALTSGSESTPIVPPWNGGEHTRGQTLHSGELLFVWEQQLATVQLTANSCGD